MSPKKSQIRVALLQFAAVDGEVERNFRTLQKWLRRLKGPVDLVVLPEMWPSGFRVKGGKLLLRQTREAQKALAEWAKKRDAVVIGSHLEGDRKGFYNTATVISPQGRVLGRYQKVHLFQMGNEHKKFIHGKAARVVKTPVGRLGLAICYDIRFPELLRKEVLAGAQVLVIPSAWPRERIDHYLSLLKARAIENLCYVVSANKVGKNALGMTYGGHSVAYDPWGRKLGELGGGPGILKVTLDLNQVKKIRRSFPVFQARREGVY